MPRQRIALSTYREASSQTLDLSERKRPENNEYDFNDTVSFLKTSFHGLLNRVHEDPHGGITAREIESVSFNIAEIVHHLIALQVFYNTALAPRHYNAHPERGNDLENVASYRNSRLERDFSPEELVNSTNEDQGDR